tara:strand:+ start:2709 stop:3011 length:303 start_codon:yes stop_codon:yes gene_type:complete
MKFQYTLYIKGKDNMKIFIYKVLVTSLFVFLIYQLTVGYTISKFEQRFYSLGSKENAELVKNKIREEMSKGLEKDRILKKDDAILLKKFIDKIRIELGKD